MLNTGRLAAPQYQKIMAQGTDYFKLTIQNYLDARAREDELFAPRYANPKKNIDDCCTFIINQVRQSGCNGFADEEIYSMALHYYDEEDIDIGKPVSCVNRSQYAERIVKVVRSDERAAGLRFVGLPIRTCHFDPVGNHGVQVQPLAAVRGLQG